MSQTITNNNAGTAEQVQYTVDGISQQLSKTEICIEGVSYRITGPMRISPRLRPIAGILVQLFRDEMYSTTELTVEEYLRQKFELGANDPARVFKTLRVRWEGEEKPTSWVNWSFIRHGKHLSIYLSGPCSTYATVNCYKISG